MAVTIAVDYGVLREAERGWGIAADDLDGAVSRLALVSGAGLSPLVAAEVDAFAQRWWRETMAIAAVASLGRAAFAQVGADYRVTDRHQAERIRSLMPWGERHDAIRDAG
ncbi:MAG TPA: hypothetical protein VJ872_07495 [Nocardioides sp.]|nr:hypothetical protein [Nocardioides sp.]